MGTETVIAIISAFGSVVGSFAGIMINSKLVNYRIEQLEKKVDMHNQVVERVYMLERRNAVFEEEIRAVNHRIDDVEKTLTED